MAHHHRERNGKTVRQSFQNNSSHPNASLSLAMDLSPSVGIDTVVGVGVEDAGSGIDIDFSLLVLRLD